MNSHPISNLFKISMDSIKEMIDVDTIVGEMMNVGENIAIIPISKVKCAFATGGTDQNSARVNDQKEYPFGGATGGSVTITPIAFLVIMNSEVKLLHLEDKTHLNEMIIEKIPTTIASIKDLFTKNNNPKVTNVEVIERK